MSDKLEIVNDTLLTEIVNMFNNNNSNSPNKLEKLLHYTSLIG